MTQSSVITRIKVWNYTIKLHNAVVVTFALTVFMWLINFDNSETCPIRTVIPISKCKQSSQKVERPIHINNSQSSNKSPRIFTKKQMRFDCGRKGPLFRRNQQSQMFRFNLSITLHSGTVNVSALKSHFIHSKFGYSFGSISERKILPYFVFFKHFWCCVSIFLPSILWITLNTVCIDCVHNRTHLIYYSNWVFWNMNINCLWFRIK